MKNNQEKNRPVYAKTLGHVRLSVFRNTYEGKTYHNTTIVRRYKDAEGNWRDSNSFNGVVDLAALSEGIEQVKRWLSDHEDRVREEQACGDGEVACEGEEAGGDGF